jgi:hypothetical protein
MGENPVMTRRTEHVSDTLDLAITRAALAAAGVSAPEAELASLAAGRSMMMERLALIWTVGVDAPPPDEARLEPPSFAKWTE